MNIIEKKKQVSKPYLFLILLLLVACTGKKVSNNTDIIVEKEPIMLNLMRINYNKRAYTQYEEKEGIHLYFTCEFENNTTCELFLVDKENYAPNSFLPEKQSVLYTIINGDTILLLMSGFTPFSVDPNTKEISKLYTLIEPNDTGLINYLSGIMEDNSILDTLAVYYSPKRTNLNDTCQMLYPDIKSRKSESFIKHENPYNTLWEGGWSTDNHWH